MQILGLIFVKKMQKMIQKSKEKSRPLFEESQKLDGLMKDENLFKVVTFYKQNECYRTPLL